MSLPKYDEIHVISDLHMGGREGFQILHETGRMADYINWVAERRPDERVALILNGDVIDTLAEEGVEYIAMDNCETVVKRIIDDPSFVPVWDSLTAFVQTPKRRLIIVIGNHDLELSFPLVQNVILERLAESDVERGRILFSTSGGGYSCMVGSKRIFCTHGNEVDAWNFNRYEELARAARRLNCGRTFAHGEWISNAGTRLVIEVMNSVKKKYPWIDLLKPEDKAAVGVLVVLDHSILKKISEFFTIYTKKTVESFEVDGRLSVDEELEVTKSSKPVSLDQLLGPNLKEAVLRGGGGQVEVDELMKMVEAGYEDFNPEAETDEQTLGWGQLIIDKLTKAFTGISDEEALRKALCDWLEGDRTFDVKNEDESCTELMDSVGAGIDVVIAGHTHLERGIELDNGRYYFNCGTWIRLMKFTEDMLADEAAFKPVYRLLKKCTYKDIDKAVFGDQHLVLDQCGAVWLREEGGRVGGGLYHVKKAAPGKVTLEPVVEIE